MMQLNSLLKPRSVALFGWPGEKLSKIITDTVASSAFNDIFLVGSGACSPEAGRPYYRANELPLTPDLALICTNALAAPEAMAEACAIGIKTAVVISPDPEGSNPDTLLKKSLREIAARHGCRFLGPSSAGLNLPIVGLNASWMDNHPIPGQLAVVSQSGSVAAGAVLWAASHGIGLSRVISTGDEADITLDEILDCLAADTSTTSVLLYLRHLKSGRSFVSAARALARIKPVLVLKPRESSGFLVSDAFIRRDQVYDSVFRRIGILRVDDTSEWFDAAAVLGRKRRRRAGKVAVVGDADGSVRLAVGLIEAEDLLATLQERTIQVLERLPTRGVVANPLILARDAGSEHYAAALSAMENDVNVSAVLVVLSPTRPLASAVALRALAQVARKSTLQISVCCFGQTLDGELQSVLAEANVAVYDLPERAARGFVYLDRFRRNQEQLRQIPIGRRRQLLAGPAASSQTPAQPLLLTEEKESPLFLKALGAIWQAAWADRDLLDDHASETLLQAYGLGSAQPASGEVRSLPGSLAIGNDPAFGRVILVSIAGQREIVLPPLNQELTKELALKMAAAVQDATSLAVNEESIQFTLIRLADMAVELPEITKLQTKAIGLKDRDLTLIGAQIRVAIPDRMTDHLSINPYPTGLEERLRMKCGDVLIRPMRIEDIRLYRDMLNLIPAPDLLMRFFSAIGDTAQAIPTDLIANLMHLDYSRDMTFVAIRSDDAGQPEMLSVVEVFMSPGRDEAEYSILVRSDVAGSGLGPALMNKIITYCRAQEVVSIFGLVLRKNARMLGLCAKLGFTVIGSPDEDPDLVKTVLTL